MPGSGCSARFPFFFFDGVARWGTRASFSLTWRCCSFSSTWKHAGYGRRVRTTCTSVSAVLCIRVEGTAVHTLYRRTDAAAFRWASPAFWSARVVYLVPRISCPEMRQQHDACNTARPERSEPLTGEPLDTALNSAALRGSRVAARTCCRGARERPRGIPAWAAGSAGPGAPAGRAPPGQRTRGARKKSRSGCAAPSRACAAPMDN